VTEFQKDIKEGKPDVVKYLVQDEASMPPGATLKEDKTAFVLSDDQKTEVKLYTAGVPDFDKEVGALGAATTNAMKVFRATDPDGFKKLQQADLGYVRTPYVVVAGVVLAFLGLFAFSKMPVFKSEEPDAPFLEITTRIFRRPRFFGGVLAQLFYVGAQIMCWTFVVHYGMEQVGLTLSEAQMYNIVAMVIFLISRWICTYLLRIFSPGRMLCAFALGGIVFTIGAIYLPGQIGLISLVLISACMSLMFPTIYGIALNGMEEEEAKLGSAYLIMSIVGGAVLTKLQGGMITDYGVRTSFWLPVGCFVVIAIYGFLTFSIFEPQAKREMAASKA